MKAELTDDQRHEFENRVVRAAWRPISHLRMNTDIPLHSEVICLFSSLKAAQEEIKLISKELSDKYGKDRPHISLDSTGSVSACVAAIIVGIEDEEELDGWTSNSVASLRLMAFVAFQKMSFYVGEIDWLMDSIVEGDPYIGSDWPDDTLVAHFNKKIADRASFEP